MSLLFLFYIGILVSAALSGLEMPPPAGLLLFGVVLSVHLWFLALMFTLRYEVTAEELRAFSVFGARVYRWRDVVSVDLAAVYGISFLGFNIHLWFAGMRVNTAVMASYFGNRHELARAVVEAAVAGSEHTVSLSSILVGAYGRPPYGIFYGRTR